LPAFADFRKSTGKAKATNRPFCFVFLNQYGQPFPNPAATRGNNRLQFGNNRLQFLQP